jgi:hypothetical protein
MPTSSAAFAHGALNVSLRLGAIEAQRFRLWPELEAQDRGDSLLFSNDPTGSLGA